MFRTTALCVALLSGVSSVMADTPDEKSKKSPAALDFTMKSLEGKEVDLGKYAGKVVLVVNVASKCGLTPQYEQLQTLHKKYADAGLAILAGRHLPGRAGSLGVNQEFRGDATDFDLGADAADQQ